MENSVCIIIPTRNEVKYIERCLQSIICSTYKKELLKVYVCDGMSNDGTIEIIKQYNSRFPFIHFLENHNLTTPFALNLGINNSDSEVIIILGAHAEIEPDYISHCTEILFSNPEIGCVGGIIENISENSAAEIIGFAMSSSFGVGNAHFRTGAKDGFTDTVAFGAYKRTVVNEIGIFDENLARNQDDEYNFRLTSWGYKIYFSNKIRSKYYVRSSYKNLFKQYYQYGYWKVFVNKKHQTITTLRQLIPMIFVLFLLLFFTGSFFSHFALIIFLLVSSTYILLGLYFGKKKSNSIFKTIKILFCFLILHISYGTGYLEGVLDFFVLKKNPGKTKMDITR